jgi:hypothetical protein
VNHHGVRAKRSTFHFSDMFFLVVFGDKKVSRILESHVGIHRSLLLQFSSSHFTTRVFSVIEFKKCTQTSKNTRFAWAGGTFFPVVLLCQFFVLAGNRLWLYILLCT